MKEKFRVNCIVTILFLLLGVGLRFVPGIRFSSTLCFGLAGVSLVYAGLKFWGGKSPVGKWCKRIFLVGLAGVILLLGCVETVIIRHGEEDLTALPVDVLRRDRRDHHVPGHRCDADRPCIFVVSARRDVDAAHRNRYAQHGVSYLYAE